MLLAVGSASASAARAPHISHNMLFPTLAGTEHHIQHAAQCSRARTRTHTTDNRQQRTKAQRQRAAQRGGSAAQLSYVRHTPYERMCACMCAHGVNSHRPYDSAYDDIATTPCPRLPGVLPVLPITDYRLVMVLARMPKCHRLIGDGLSCDGRLARADDIRMWLRCRACRRTLCWRSQSPCRCTDRLTAGTPLRSAMPSAWSARGQASPLPDGLLASAAATCRA